MKNVLILHGTDMRQAGNQNQGNWFPWLKNKLIDRGYEVLLPELPQAHTPNLETYWNFLQDKFHFNSDTIIVGHSSGATATLGLLHKLPSEIKIKAVILVAGFLYDRKWKCEGLLIPFDWQKIRHQVRNIYIIHSDNDPYVPLTDAQEIAKHLKINLILQQHQGHFSTNPKYEEFPFLLEIFDQIESGK